MNKLAVKLFLIKYYDLVFLGILFILFIGLFIYEKNLKKKDFIVTLKKRLHTLINNIGIKWVILLVILLAFIVRLYKINNPIADWHSFRQADTASVTRIYLERGINLLYPRYHDISTTQSGLFNPRGYRFVEFPAFNFVHALLASNLPFFSLEVWGRLVSIFSALISIYCVFLIGKRFISVKGGFIASLFFAFLPFNIYFTRVILPEPMAVALGLSFLWFFIVYIDTDNKLYLYLSSVLFSLAILVKPYLIFYSIPAVTFSLEKYKFRRLIFKKELFMATVLTLLPFILWRVWMQQFPEGIPFWKWTLNGDDIRFKPAFWYWIFGERLSKLILGFWGLVPLIIGIFKFNNKRSFIYYFLAAMFIYICVFATANVRHDYYQIIAIPAISLVFAVGIIEIVKSKVYSKTVNNIFLAFLITISFFLGVYQVKEFYKINHPEIISAGEIVDKITPKDALVIAPYNGDTAFLYQTKRNGWPVVDRPIDELIKEGAKYFVSVDLNHYQTLEFEKRFRTIEKTSSFIILDLTTTKN